MVPDPRVQPTMTVDEAAGVIGVSRGVAYEAARNGELPVIHMGRRVLVVTAGLRRLLGLDVVDDVEETPERDDAGAPTPATVLHLAGTPSKENPRVDRTHRPRTVQ